MEQIGTLAILSVGAGLLFLVLGSISPRKGEAKKKPSASSSSNESIGYEKTTARQNQSMAGSNSYGSNKTGSLVESHPGKQAASTVAVGE